MSKRRIITDPQNMDADSKAIFILDNLSAGRTPEDLITHIPGLSLDVIEATKKRVLEAAIHENDHSFFRTSLRIRHLTAALQPHPIVNIICDAFAEVRLGKGLSLRQMYVADDYGNDESGRPMKRGQYNHLRHEDETNQWNAVKVVDLDAYLHYFCYANAESFRFHIPALMIYSLVQPLWEVIFYLKPEESHRRESQ